jgi:hypothetical protein
MQDFPSCSEVGRIWTYIDIPNCARNLRKVKLSPLTSEYSNYDLRSWISWLWFSVTRLPSLFAHYKLYQRLIQVRLQTTHINISLSLHLNWFLHVSWLSNTNGEISGLRRGISEAFILRGCNAAVFRYSSSTGYRSNIERSSKPRINYKYKISCINSQKSDGLKERPCWL